ncbi:VAMP-like protein YKT61 [Acorus gramineus]|uniref:VAMP-like protein YKT61 n=1 Tax=Acorus gramineus TaxID=55184 RepID=A0AAV9BSF7_ACOGR|nr:VAMP-like protein YKT61 [Acorus gramineus]
MVMKSMGPESASDPVVLASESDLSHFRSSNPSQFSFVTIFKSSTRCTLWRSWFVDDHYPMRSAFALLNKMIYRHVKKALQRK